MAKTKLKAKAKKKLPRSKLKAKAKAKAKKKLPRSKLKAKVKNTLRPKSKTKQAKPKAKRKTVGKKKVSKIVAKTKQQVKPTKTKSKPMAQFTGKQKSDLLITIEKIINLHKSDKDGLKSLTKIERILDKYNQNYTGSDEKFNAIAEYGAAEDSSVMREHVFIPVIGKDKELKDIYKLLANISNGKIKYSDAKNKIEDIYMNALESRQK